MKSQYRKWKGQVSKRILMFNNICVNFQARANCAPTIHRS